MRRARSCQATCQLKTCLLVERSLSVSVYGARCQAASSPKKNSFCFFFFLSCPLATGRFPCNSPKEKMVIASLTGVVEVMRKGG